LRKSLNTPGKIRIYVEDNRTYLYDGKKTWMAGTIQVKRKGDKFTCIKESDKNILKAVVGELNKENYEESFKKLCSIGFILKEIK